MKAPLEQDILKQCLAWLSLHGVFCWRQNQGAVVGEYQGKRRFTRFCGAAGVSDILGLLPVSGRLLAIEVKRPGKKPTEHQAAFLQRVQACGGLAVCVHGIDELAAVVLPAIHNGRRT